jgi:hypothetical protein
MLAFQSSDDSSAQQVGLGYFGPKPNGKTV